MGRLAIRWTQQDLLNAIARRNRLWHLNDLRARNDPGFKQQLDYLRNYDGLKDRTDAMEMQVLGGSGLGAVPIAVIAIGSAVVLAPLGIALLIYVWRQGQREEQAYAATNPLMYAMQQASTGVWALLGLGVVGLVGLMYYDYRSSAPQHSYGGGYGGGREFRAPPPQLPAYQPTRQARQLTQVPWDDDEYARTRPMLPSGRRRR